GQRDDLDPVSRRLARAARPDLHTGADLVPAQDRLLLFLLPVGARDFPALPLRPADAAGLEGVPAVFAVLAGLDRRRPDGHGVAAPLGQARRKMRMDRYGVT